MTVVKCRRDDNFWTRNGTLHNILSKHIDLTTKENRKARITQQFWKFLKSSTKPIYAPGGYSTIARTVTNIPNLLTNDIKGENPWYIPKDFATTTNSKCIRIKPLGSVCRTEKSYSGDAVEICQWNFFWKQHLHVTHVECNSNTCWNTWHCSNEADGDQVPQLRAESPRQQQQQHIWQKLKWSILPVWKFAQKGERDF